MDVIRFAVIGMAGYARAHLQAVEWLARRYPVRLTAVVVQEQERSRFAAEIDTLQQHGVRLFADVAALLSRGQQPADVLTVATGIHQHAEISIAAMQAGLHVYCEKPAAATIAEVDRMQAVSEDTGRLCSIGFQYLYSPTIRALKQLICSGRAGSVRRVRILCGWPRSTDYYRRNAWAGRLRLGGRWVLDSPANNAMAHYLLNALWLAGSEPDRAAAPQQVQAALYRANAIESCDTCTLRIHTQNGAEIFAALAHTGEEIIGPEMEVRCEQAVIHWDGQAGAARVTFADGSREEFHDAAEPDWRFAGFEHLVTAIREGKKLLCPPKTARAHTQVIAAMHASCPDILTLPDGLIERVRAREVVPPYRQHAEFRRIRGMDALLRQAYVQCALFSEFAGPDWRQDAQVVRVAP